MKSINSEFKIKNFQKCFIKVRFRIYWFRDIYSPFSGWKSVLKVWWRIVASWCVVQVWKVGISQEYLLRNNNQEPNLPKENAKGFEIGTCLQPLQCCNERWQCTTTILFLLWRWEYLFFYFDCKGHLPVTIKKAVGWCSNQNQITFYFSTWQIKLPRNTNRRSRQSVRLRNSNRFTLFT